MRKKCGTPKRRYMTLCQVCYPWPMYFNVYRSAFKVNSSLLLAVTKSGDDAGQYTNCALLGI